MVFEYSRIEYGVVSQLVSEVGYDASEIPLNLYAGYSMLQLSVLVSDRLDFTHQKTYVRHTRSFSPSIVDDHSGTLFAENSCLPRLWASRSTAFASHKS